MNLREKTTNFINSNSNKIMLVLASLLVLLIVSNVVFINMWSNAKNQAEIDKNNDELEVVQSNIEDSKKKMKQNDDNFLNDQRNSVKESNKIAEKYKNFTPIKYETPIIPDADYSAKLDTLRRAMPDE